MLFDSDLCRTPAKALTHDELLAKLEAAGYSQVRENGSGKIKTFKAVKNGKDVSVIVDSFGRKKLQWWRVAAAEVKTSTGAAPYWRLYFSIKMMVGSAFFGLNYSLRSAPVSQAAAIARSEGT